MIPIALAIMMAPPFDAMHVDYAAFSVSAYVDSPLWGNVSASGAILQDGDCACGPGYPFGTIFVLSSGHVLICRDRGSAITDGHIDIYMHSEEQALKWGRQYLPIIILQWGG